MKSSEPVPLIEVIQEESYSRKIEGIVKFKGKQLHPEVIEFCDAECAAVKMPAEILFDFKAGELPEDMHWVAQMLQGECLGLLLDAGVERHKRYAELQFSFVIDEEEPSLADLNPYVTLPALTELIRKEGYKVSTYEGEPFNVYVELLVPFGDNVYTHYKKHLAVFEKMCRTIERDVMKRLSKKFKSR